jgi:hypothetical protein
MFVYVPFSLLILKIKLSSKGVQHRARKDGESLKLALWKKIPPSKILNNRAHPLEQEIQKTRQISKREPVWINFPPLTLNYLFLFQFHSSTIFRRFSKGTTSGVPSTQGFVWIINGREVTPVKRNPRNFELYFM